MVGEVELGAAFDASVAVVVPTTVLADAGRRSLPISAWNVADALLQQFVKSPNGRQQ